MLQFPQVSDWFYFVVTYSKPTYYLIVYMAIKFKFVCCNRLGFNYTLPGPILFLNLKIVCTYSVCLRPYVWTQGLLWSWLHNTSARHLKVYYFSTFSNSIISFSKTDIINTVVISN